MSFHRPHSPYDPPQRVLDTVNGSRIRHPHYSVDDWDTKFATASECGPSHADAWCGRMEAKDLETTRRSYYASVQFVDEWVGSVVQVCMHGLGAACEE